VFVGYVRMGRREEMSLEQAAAVRSDSEQSKWLPETGCSVVLLCCDALNEEIGRWWKI